MVFETVYFGDWLEAELRPTLIQIIARVTPLIFVGPELSRDPAWLDITSFADGLRAATAGRGVDVVLNLLSGELLHTSWRCVAPGGTFIELGKRDAAARCKLAMDPLDDNRAFIRIDMARLAVLDGAEIRQLLDRIVYLYRGMVLTPNTPSRAFPCKEIQKAFQSLSRIGGLVHLAMVLADVEMPRITVIEWQAAAAPRIAGTWNPHRALCNGGDGGEDFFVLIGSMLVVTGRAGQANYAAANAFLDSFVQF
ncbi:KR domain-containing protein [Colletotrichum higginsianum]|uniref:KR domain-containing protein n=1 Tax=Colletotrichum higginsianum (strain IMI 349063) TaxID=759273 RepID=H1V145_COLHI|nr:KR domain-containing protein [Colletotrichum higginsianum]